MVRIKFSFALALLVLAPGLLMCGGGDSRSNCPVRIELAESKYSVSGQVRPKLQSLGPRSIYVSGIWPRGFRVESQSEGKWVPYPSKPREEGSDQSSSEFRFSDPLLLPIVWSDVASELDDKYMTVPAGVYRFVLDVALQNPDGENAAEVEWCRIKSAPFELEQEDSYTIWR